MSADADFNGQMPASIAIVQRFIADYRIPFYNGLEIVLEKAGIGLTVLAGSAPTHEALRDGIEDVVCAERVANRAVFGKVYWQPLLERLQSFDLVVVEQANAALINYPLLLFRRQDSRPRVAYWGHGRTMAPGDNGIVRNFIKRKMTTCADHWFAYTELSRRIVLANGIPDDRITVVNNSIDTRFNETARAKINGDERHQIRRSLGLGNGPVAAYCSRLLDRDKLPFLLDSVRRAREAVDGLELLLIGGGPLFDWAKSQAETLPWLHPIGPLYGEEKARALACAEVLVMPAFVGLSILDAFSTGLPLITTHFLGHGPEIEYLVDGENGLITDTTSDAFASALAGLVADDTRRQEMAEAALRTARRYTLDAMIQNFATGAQAALERRPRAGSSTATSG